MNPMHHNNPMPPKISGASAFTLTELIVVTGITGILFGLIIGGIARAKMAAHRVTCINNLKQWAYATHVYAPEHDEQLPREAAVDGINSWEMTSSSTNNDVWYNALPETVGIMTMAQYAQTPSSQQAFYTAGKIFHCPRARFSDVSATYPNFSLAMNSKLMRDFERTQPPGAPRAPTFGCKLTRIKMPDSTALFLDNGVDGEERLCLFQPPYTGQPKAFASQFPGRHNRGGNIAFADGHVRTLPGNDVVEMNPTNPNCGGAIHPPREVIWCSDPTAPP
jgi:prepilin-type processing-associated H-X9-DG protein